MFELKKAEVSLICEISMDSGSGQLNRRFQEYIIRICSQRGWQLLKIIKIERNTLQISIKGATQADFIDLFNNFLTSVKEKPDLALA
ncbi:hypothetical protein GF382_01350 [Candidatus Falkowbacteria bacterium]|nr:hypothetical protein [Candidatus Falkowbacteria bacterium]